MAEEYWPLRVRFRIRFNCLAADQAVGIGGNCGRVAYEAIQVDVIALESDGVFGGPAADGGLQVAVAVVIVAGFLVALAALESVGVRQVEPVVPLAEDGAKGVVIIVIIM